jgi:predicted nucleic acid-binding protein
MRSTLVVDTGPLIALFDADDKHHERVKAWYQAHSHRGISTLAVVTEVVYSLSRLEAQLDFLHWARRAILLVELSEEDFDRCIQVMSKYGDLPADFADATLVAIAERLNIREILTFDSDFRVYKFRNREAFRLPLMDAVAP